MTAKEYLSQLQDMSANINAREAELHEMREKITSIGGMADGERVQSSGNKDRIASAVVRCIDKESALIDMINEYNDLLEVITYQICELDNWNHKDILTKKYLENRNLLTVSEEMGYTYEWVREMHGRALQEFEKRFLKNLQKPTETYKDKCYNDSIKDPL